MKKGIIIALCSLAVLFVACKKPVEPTPEPIDYTPNYVGNYIGQFLFSDIKMVSNGQPQTISSLPIENIRMEIAKTEQFNEITATVTVDNESRQTSGTATAEKADFKAVRLIIDKPDQNYSFNLDLKMEGAKESDTLNITGTFSGDGTLTFNGVENILKEVSGNLNGKLVKH